MLIIVGLIGAGVVVAAVIIGVTVASVLSIRQGLTLTPVTEQGYDEQLAAVQSHADWAEGQGFDFVGAYVTRQAGVEASIAAWWHRRRPTYFCMYLAGGKTVYDFVTLFSESRALTTGSSMDGQFLPHRPGHYAQTFSDCSVDELFNRHAAAEHFLMTAGRIETRPPSWSFEEAISRSVASQGAYIQSLPLWPLLSLYWFLIKKRLLHNKPVEELHRAGRILLPHEPGFKEFECRS